MDNQKVAVVYNSRGGNTQTVAETLAGRLEHAGYGVKLASITATSDEASAAASAAGTVLVGFWCDKGSCTDEVSALLGQLAGKRVFLFGTAGFGGSAEYFERILSGVREKLPADAIYLGGAMCQGRMAPAVRKRYEAVLAEKPGDERAQAMIDNFDAAASHPDDRDLAGIAEAALSALA